MKKPYFLQSRNKEGLSLGRLVFLFILTYLSVIYAIIAYKVGKLDDLGTNWLWLLSMLYLGPKTVIALENIRSGKINGTDNNKPTAQCD